ncbi:hypothetical protein KI387_027886, partial [Taxus chinensis]
ADFESHLGGREHEMQLKKMEQIESLTEIEHNGTECAIAGGKELINIERGLAGNDTVQRRVEKESVNDDRDKDAKNEK